jgi:hypothetical protein
MSPPWGNFVIKCKSRSATYSSRSVNHQAIAHTLNLSRLKIDVRSRVRERIAYFTNIFEISTNDSATGRVDIHSSAPESCASTFSVSVQSLYWRTDRRSLPRALPGERAVTLLFALE